MGGAGREAGSRTGTSAGWRVLAILLLAYIFNFIDRQIIGILAVPIKAELGLSDQQLGILGGVAFALFYSGIAIPVAWLADRGNRVTIIAASVALWSGFTAACGLAQSFWQLFVARMGVGIGEAGGVAPSHALIADLFPRHRRARALAVFALGIPIGSALGIFFGGWIAANLDWRAAFLIAGLAGLPVALAVRLGIREPVRGGLDQPEATAAGAAPHVGETAAFLARKPSFWLLSFGAAAGSIPGYGLMFWLPSFFDRSFGLELTAIGWFFGSIVLIGGTAGIWAGGWVADRMGPSNPSSYARIPGACFLVAAPVYATALFAPNLAIGWLLFAIGQMLALAWLGPVTAAVQHLVPPNMRATASASFLFINNLIGIGVGIYVLGVMSDRLQASLGADALRYSILYGLGFYLLSAIVYGGAALRLEKDWHRA